jgi:hypothetical protein
MAMLFDLWIAKHGISDELRTALAEDCALFAQALRERLIEESGFASANDLLLNQKLDKVIDDSKCEMARLAAARDRVRH